MSNEDVVEFGKRIETFEEMKHIERMRKEKQVQEPEPKKTRGRPPKSKTDSETEQ